MRHEKFQDLVFNVNTATNAEFKDLRKGLVKDVRTADRQVKELKTRAVDMVRFLPLLPCMLWCGVGSLC